MSLIDMAHENPHARKPSMLEPAEKQAKPRVLQAGILLRVADRAIQENMLDAPKSEELVKTLKHRVRVTDCDWPLANVLGTVTEDLWANMVGCALEGMEQVVKHRQPNGVWRIAEYEIDIRNRGGQETIMVAIKWVDLDNAVDLQYRDGVPAVNVQVNAPGLPPELIEFIRNQQAGGATAGPVDDRLTAAIERLATATAESNRMMREMAMRTEVKATGKKKDAAPDADPTAL
jgi:hypothetical protein